MQNVQWRAFIKSYTALDFDGTQYFSVLMCYKLIFLLHWSTKSCWNSQVESDDWRPDVANLLRGRVDFLFSTVSLSLRFWCLVCGEFGFCGGAASRASWVKTVTRPREWVMAACAAAHTCTQRWRGSRNVPHADTNICYMCNKIPKTKKVKWKQKRKLPRTGVKWKQTSCQTEGFKNKLRHKHFYKLFLKWNLKLQRIFGKWK